MITNNRKDKSDKNLLVQQYIWAMINWLAKRSRIVLTEYVDEELSHKVFERLGRESPAKDLYLRMLIARLTHDGISTKKLQGQVEDKKLFFNIEQIDVFDNHLSKQLDNLLQIIGNITSGNGCPTESTSDDEQMTSAEYEFSTISQQLIMQAPADEDVDSGIEKTVKRWLTWRTSKHLQLNYSFAEFLCN
jgi:hypothetical protein